jgi:hypothetical protein
MESFCHSMLQKIANFKAGRIVPISEALAAMGVASQPSWDRDPAVQIGSLSFDAPSKPPQGEPQPRERLAGDDPPGWYEIELPAVTFVRWWNGECWHYERGSNPAAIQYEDARNITGPLTYSPDLTRQLAEAQQKVERLTKREQVLTEHRDLYAYATTHRCKKCGCLWRKWGDGSWSLLDKYQKPEKCCDNEAMGEQIEEVELGLFVTAAAEAALKAVVERAENGIGEAEANRLAAISTAALANTPVTAAAARIANDHPCWTAAYEDVFSAVQREIRERERAEAAEKELAQLRDQFDKKKLDSLYIHLGRIASAAIDAGWNEKNDIDEFIASLQAEVEKLRSREKCEHCGSDRIYHGPPDCPGCGAPTWLPNMLQT